MPDLDFLQRWPDTKTGPYRIRIQIKDPEVSKRLPAPYTGTTQITYPLKTRDTKDAVERARPVKAKLLAIKARAEGRDITSAVFRTLDMIDSGEHRTWAELGYMESTPAPEPNPLDNVKLIGVPSKTIIDLWKSDRDKAPGTRSIRNKENKAARLFKSLGLPDDWTLLTADHLQRYKEHLLNEGGNSLARDHLIDLTKLARVAYANRKITTDIAENIKVPPQRQKAERVPLSDKEAALILNNLPDDPVIAWTNRLISCWGFQTAELIDADVRDVEIVDGILCVHIRPDYRVGDLKTAFRKRTLPVPSRYRDDFAAYVDSVRSKHGAAGSLFPMLTPDQDGSRANKASQRLIPHIRKLGIKGEPARAASDTRAAAPGILRDFYSWRGRVTTQLEKLTTYDRSRYIVGHAPRDVHARSYLDHPVGELLAVIDSIPDVTITPMRDAA